MKNKTSNAKIILFASLIAVMILPFNMAGNANAQAVYDDVRVENDNEKYDFLTKAVSEIGTWETKLTNGGYTELWKYNVVKYDDQTKHVILNILVHDKHGNEVGNYNIEFKVKYDSETDTYEVHNTRLDETKK